MSPHVPEGRCPLCRCAARGGGGAGARGEARRFTGLRYGLREHADSPHPRPRLPQGGGD